MVDFEELFDVPTGQPTPGNGKTPALERTEKNQTKQAKRQTDGVSEFKPQISAKSSNEFCSRRILFQNK